MNPWPDDYVEPPDEQEVFRTWKEHAAWWWMPVLGHYLHHLTEQVRALQALCDEQAAELTALTAEVVDLSAFKGASAYMQRASLIPESRTEDAT